MFSKLVTHSCFAALVACAAATAFADSKLADAAQRGDLKAVRALLRQGDVNATQPDGSTALLWAVDRDDLEMTNVLLAAGADIRLANRTGARPLYLAAVDGTADMVVRLLKAGEDANAVLTTENETALMLSSRSGNIAAVNALLEHGADANARQVRGQTALMWAAADDHVDVIKSLLAHGADIGLSTVATVKPEKRPPGGMTALLFAVRQGKMAATKALLDSGADVNQAGADNTSPLLIAVLNSHYEIASLLLERGANPNVADANGRAPLYAAIDMRNGQWAQYPAPELPQAMHLAMIKQLVAAGADVSAKVTGKTKHRGSFDMRWSDMKNSTPFLRAAWNGDVEVMRYLLEHGADPRVTTDKNETALLLLTGAGWPLGQGYLRSDADIAASLELLVGELKLDVNATTTEGISPLICAVFKGSNNVVQYLVDHGAKLDVKDKKGRSLIDWAQGIAANDGQPPRPQPDTEKLVRELMAKQGVRVASN